METTILGKVLKVIGTVIVMTGLLMFGIIFIIAPGLAADLGWIFLRSAE